MHQKILILDFGSQVHPTHRAPRARGRGLLRTASQRRDRRSSCATSRRPASFSRAGRIRCTRRKRRARPRSCSSSACRCWASATACRPWRRNWAARSKLPSSANSATPKSARAAIPLLLRDIQDRVNDEGHGLLDVWMSHGDKVTALPAGFKVMASNAATPIAAMADEDRQLLRRAVPPRSHPHPAGQGDLRALRARHLRLRLRLEHAGLRRRSHRQGRARGRQRRSDSRPVRRRRFLGGRGAAASRHRRRSSPACSSTTACCA